MSKLKCLWNMGTDCNGPVAKTNMFSAQLCVPICEKHIREHNVLMDLHAEGANIDYVTKINNSERERTVVDSKINFKMIRSIYIKVLKYKVNPIELNILNEDTTIPMRKYLKINEKNGLNIFTIDIRKDIL